MHSGPKRPSFPSKNSSTAQVTAIQSRPASARSILSPSSLSKGCSIRPEKLRGEAARAPTSGSKASHKDAHVKPNVERSVDGRGTATIARGSNTIPTRTSPTSKDKAASLSSGPVSRTTKKLLSPSGKFEHNASNGTPSRRAGPSRKKLGPENWTPITAGKVTTCTPPPWLKLQRQKRASVLPREDGLSLFGPVHVPQNEIYEDIFYKFKSNPSLRLTHGRTSFVVPHAPPKKSCTRSESPELVQDVRGSKITAKPPSHHFKLRARVASKTVSWDPSIIVIGPKTRSNEEEIIEKSSECEHVDVAHDQIPTHESDVKDCVETIKQWGKADKSKLASLIEALKEMELNSRDITDEAVKAKEMDSHSKEIIITTVQSLDPRVPDFQLPQLATTEEKLGQVDEQKRSSRIKQHPGSSSDSDSNKENIPEPPSLESLASTQANTTHRSKKRTIAILDDPDLPGREINSFDRWYGELQLHEFAKKYPLTGCKAPVVRSGLVRNSAKTLTSCGDVKRVSSSLIRGCKIDVGGKNLGGSGAREVMGERGDDGGVLVAATNGKPDYSLKSENPRPRRRVKPLLVDPSARLNAAYIQQRLEMLLLKEKERKALEGCRPVLQTVLPSQGTGIAGVGQWSWGGNLFASGLEYESSGNSEQVWVPSERLRL